MPFLFDIDVIHPRQYNIQLRFVLLNKNYLGWINSNITQKDMLIKELTLILLE